MKFRKDNIFVIGQSSSEMVGAKLPSCRQVLSRLFHEIRENQLTVRESASVIVEEMFLFWRKARIPTRAKVKCVGAVVKLYDNWRALQKKKNRESDTKRPELFVQSLENLFDIAASDALQRIPLEEDRLFLIAQRKPGREGSMTGVDLKVARKEKRSRERWEREENRKRKYLEDKESSSK